MGYSMPTQGGYYPQQQPGYYSYPQQSTQGYNTYPQQPFFNPQSQPSFFSQSFTHSNVQESEQPKNWREGVEKVKDKTKGFFSNIGKAFKKVFSKKVFTPILGFFGRSSIDVIGQLVTHSLKMVIPMITKENVGLYQATVDGFFGQVTNFAKESLPKVEPLEPQVDAMFTGILNALQGGLHQFRQEASHYQYQKQQDEFNEQRARFERERQEFEAKKEKLYTQTPRPTETTPVYYSGNPEIV